MFPAEGQFIAVILSDAMAANIHLIDISENCFCNTLILCDSQRQVLLTMSENSTSVSKFFYRPTCKNVYSKKESRFLNFPRRNLANNKTCLRVFKSISNIYRILKFTHEKFRDCKDLWKWFFKCMVNLETYPWKKSVITKAGDQFFHGLSWDMPLYL